jgi:hypothetical protein
MLSLGRDGGVAGCARATHGDAGTAVGPRLEAGDLLFKDRVDRGVGSFGVVEAGMNWH